MALFPKRAKQFSARRTLHSEGSVLCYASSNRDGGQQSAAAVLSLLGFQSAVPLVRGGGQRQMAARTRLTSVSSAAPPSCPFRPSRRPFANEKPSNIGLPEKEVICFPAEKYGI